MDAMPPAGSMRRRAAIALVLLIAAFWAYVFLHVLLNWITKGGPFPLYLAMSAVMAVSLGALLLREGRKQLEREP
jgi:hypothetical protein